MNKVFNNLYEILTPDGFMPFDGISQTNPQIGVTLILSNNQTFNCATKHKIKCNGSFINAEDTAGLYADSLDAYIIRVDANQIAESYYDVLETPTHEYLSSGLISHNCEFVGSVSTLIDHHFLKTLESKKPMKIPNLPEYIRIYEPPLKKEKLEAEGWEYAASLDSGYGVHQDSSVLQIFLIKSNITVHQVAVISSNKMDIDLFCKKCYVILKKYHDPALIIEQNGPGIAAMSFFYNTVEYENILHFDPSGRHMGLWASEKTKQNACILFKTYIERKFMKIYDRQTINEMHSFGKVTQERWGGLGGNHDDHITATYWIPYYIQSPYYYGTVVDVNMKELEEDEVILKTEDEIANERMTLEKMQNKSQVLKELENNAKYLSNSKQKQRNKDDDDDDSATGMVMFQR